ncbi:MAG: holo-ACP synthase [Clostridiaceae bacterium]
MIIGVGTDIIEISRIEDAVKNNANFLEKVFTDNEIEYLKSRKMRPEYIAGRFAAKEAVSKALGTGFREFSLRDIEVDRNTLGKPMVILKGKAKQIALRHGKYRIHLSISHDKSRAIAYAVMEEEA